MKTAIVLLFALAAGPATAQAPRAGVDPSASTAGDVAAGVLAAMDRDADPCDDFYRYACGGWLESTQRPPDQPRWSRSFSIIRESNREVVRSLLEDAGAAPGEDPDRRRIGHFYSACMDEEAIEKSGVAPLAALLGRIDRLGDAASLLAVAAELHASGVDALFDIGVFPDFHDPDLNIAFLFQGGLGMPDRDYYVSEEEAKRELLAAYETHVARMFELLGDDAEAAARRASEVVAFETELAVVSRPREEMRIVERLYNKVDRAGLKELTPGLPWDVFWSSAGYPELTDISVATPEFFQTLERLVAATPPETLRGYLRWHLVHEMASVLPRRFVEEDFDFFGRRLAGQEAILPRWKRCVDATEAALGELVGKLYVDRRFAGSSKDVATEMILDIEKAFERNLPHLTWMEDATRRRAMEKVEAVGNKIGYPDVWRDYSTVSVSAGDSFANAVAAARFEFDRQLRKVGGPVDEGEWQMTPQMVNAYYHPLLNEIVFPAGILQPPFFHKDFPAAMNYGGIGGVIGHELTHGFDDQGRKFDPEGRLSEWWEPEAAERFRGRAQCVEDFYSGYEVEPGVRVNGSLTLGENIADIGGVKQAYQAYKLWEKRHGRPEPAIEGLTDDQLFFVAWGQVWCTLATPEIERLLVTTDPHSPPRFRVLGPLANSPAFAEAFACAPGRPMSPPDRCQVW